MTPSTRVGVVIIGRNEGERLRRCLASVVDADGPIVYVDSGSTDDSVALARAVGATIIALDMDKPFTAARARNAGWRSIAEMAPDVTWVQFVDGDCEVIPGWLATAADYLRDNEQVVVVCGRRRERFPNASIYNLLCDLEWDTPVGTAAACGGDALFRLSALEAVGGFRDTMIAGEEPELCYRLRAAGGRIERLDLEMTLHDAALTRFRQWWVRAVRAGHAYAEGSHLTSSDPNGLWHREVRSTWFWAAFVPFVSVVLAWPTSGFSLVVGLLLYSILFIRIAARASRRWPWRQAAIYAAACVAAKLAHLQGMFRYWLNQRAGRASTIIEYKTPAASGAAP